VKLQVPVLADAVNMHVTSEPLAGVAVTVTCAPDVSDARSKVGVLSAVLLSEFDEPVSEALCRSGAAAVATVVVKDIAETDDVFTRESSVTTYAL
jgi:hypothetical protein